MKKVLIVTTISGFLPTFEMNNVKILQELGYEVHYASNFKTPVYEIENSIFSDEGIKTHQIDFIRTPFGLNNLYALKQLNMIMKKEQFDLVHTHTPMGGVLGRIAAKMNGIKHIMYTAHGFHFYKGAPMLNWLFYYPMEYILSYITNTVITINKEDYDLAKNKFKSQRIYKIPGPGIDLDKYRIKKKSNKYIRKELDIPEDAFIITTVGELNDNKNHKVIIKALALCRNKNIYYIICGKGEKLDELMRLSKENQLERNIVFLGFRKDVPEILQESNCYIMPSIREGLGVAALEGMAASLPIITSNCRGAKEFNIDGVTGFLCDYNDEKAFANAIERISSDREFARKLSYMTVKKVEEFDYKITMNIMLEVYSSILQNL